VQTALLKQGMELLLPCAWTAVQVSRSRLALAHRGADAARLCRGAGATARCGPSSCCSLWSVVVVLLAVARPVAAHYGVSWWRCSPWPVVALLLLLDVVCRGAVAARCGPSCSCSMWPVLLLLTMVCRGGAARCACRGAPAAA
jgi:hypothetical protein